MSELSRQQHEELEGTFSTDPFFGPGFVSTLGDIYVPGKAEQVNGNHYASIVNLLDSLDRRHTGAFPVYVYKDSADTEAKFSAKAGDFYYRNLLCQYAGETALGDLAVGNNNVWLDLSSAPTTISAAFGTAWPTVPHVRLATIAMPATGHWLPQHLTRLAGSQGIAPIGGSLHPISAGFAYDTTSPLTIGTVPAEGRILRAHIKIDTAFDGTAPTLQIGDDTDPARLMASGDNDPKTVGVYSKVQLYKYTSQTDVKLTITPDSSTVGSGLVLLEVM